MTTMMEYPSYFDCVADIIGRSDTPLTVDMLVEQVRAKRPTGKGVRSAVYQAIGKLYQAVPTAPGTFGWLSSLLRSQTFRHPLGQLEVQRGTLLMDELEHAVFFPGFFQDHQPDGRIVRLHLMGGPTIEAHADVEQETWALRLGKEFVAWVDQAGCSVKDDLLIHVLDADGGDYSLRLQPKESRQESEIQERNLFLARTAEAIVSGDRKARSATPVWELAAALIGRGVYADAVAPDDMHFILHEFSNLRLQDDVGYAKVGRDALRRERGGRNSGQGRGRDGDRSQYGREQPPWQETDEHTSRGGLWGDFIDRGTSDPPGDWGMDSGFWDAVEDNVADFSDMASESCEGYRFYLSEFGGMTPEEEPLSHMNYHLLEAELETLVGLEQEFGYLMPEQEERKQALAARLFIDPDIFYGGDWDQSDYDGPPFWDN